MALKGSVTIDATPNSCDRLVFAWEATQDTETRTSTIDWTMKLVADATYGLITGVIEGTRTWSVTIDGETFTGQNGVNVQPGETRLLAEGTIDLVHADDGTRSFDFTFSQEIGITWGASSGNPQEIGTVSGSGSGELDAFEAVEPEPEPDPDEPEEPEEPETEKFDLQSFLTGLAMALVSRGQFPKPTAEPVAFLYNGVRLPRLPVVEGYPHIVMRFAGGVMAYFYAFSEPHHMTMTNSDGSKCVGVTAGETYVYARCRQGGDSSFSTPEEIVADNDIFFASVLNWSNYDVLNEDGTIYLAASEPIPVYE